MPVRGCLTKIRKSTSDAHASHRLRSSYISSYSRIAHALSKGWSISWKLCCRSVTSEGRSFGSFNDFRVRLFVPFYTGFPCFFLFFFQHTSTLFITHSTYFLFSCEEHFTIFLCTRNIILIHVKHFVNT